MKTIFFTTLFFALLSGLSAQTTYYVETSGSDANPCTSGSPCATVQHVIDNFALVPGDSILVGAGTWTDEPITFTSTDDGDATDFVVLQGVDSASTIFEHFLGVTNGIHLNDANYVKVRNIKFDDASDDVVQITSGDNNVIENCWILEGADEVSIEATSGNTADNNVIRNNLMESDAFTYVDINGTNSGGTFICSGNEIYNNVMKLMSGGSATPGIELSFADDTEIHRNRMLGATRGIEIRSTGGGNNTNIYNNYIKSSDDGFYNNGTAATSSSGTLRHNSFYSARTCAYFRALSGATESGWDIRNNIFYTTSTSSSEYCLRIDGSTGAAFCDYNQYYHPGSARCGRFNGTACASLTGTAGTDWDEIDHSTQGALLGDENSQEGDPLYKNPTSTDNDLMDLLATSPCYFNAVVIVGINVDIYTVARPVAPAIGAFDNIALLPIELLSFNAVAERETTLLQWQTASETDNDYFTLQRSFDGRNWVDIGTVPGAGNSSSTLFYDFSDFDPQTGINYYRLKQTDFNGEYSYSAIKSVRFEEEGGTFGIYPNPATDIVNISLPLDIDEQLIYTIRSMEGKVVQQQVLQRPTIQTSILPTGIYILELHTTSGKPMGFQKMIIK